MSNNYDNLEELSAKITNKVSPTDVEKEILLYKLNKQLSSDEHLYIFTEVLQTLEKKIYTITENCTLFDLNDLPNEQFWRIFCYSQLFIQNHEREKEVENAFLENSSKSDKLTEKMNRDLQKLKADPNQALPEDSCNFSAYEKLRIGALSQCPYSTYAKDIDRPDLGFALHDDKKLEKTIYSDKFKHKWKQSGTDQLTIKNAIKTGIESVGVSVVDQESQEDDYDDDDMMLNENYVDTNFQSNIDHESEKAELDRLKNKLLKMQKVKLSLKVNSLNFDDDDDDDN